MFKKNQIYFRELSTNPIKAIANIMWGENDKWPFKDLEGNIIKHVRIIVGNWLFVESKILDTWPKGRYKAHKKCYGFYSYYETDTDWGVEIIVNTGDPRRFEGGRKLSLILFYCQDCSKDIIESCVMRLVHGGVVFYLPDLSNKSVFKYYKPKKKE